MSHEPVVIAHRGASGHRPEHGADAYRLAIDLGAGAIEPDIVSTSDGILVLRHENEISSTTDIEDHAEFADRRTTKSVDGEMVAGWFTEDFTWAELSTLSIRERLPELRPASALHDGEGRIQRLTDLLSLLDSEAVAGHPVALVAEIKHATYFESIGLPLDELFAAELQAAGWIDDPRLTIESFEQSVLMKLKAAGVGGRSVYLLEDEGAPFDLVARDGTAATTYAEQLTDEGLARLAAEVEGVSVPKRLLITKYGRPDASLVRRAHAHGLEVFTWTLRPENKFVVKALRTGPDKAAFGDWRAEFERVIGTGVDGIFTDYPDLAVEILHRAHANA
ncbi:glycerophosphodiester phosphodiesterase [Frondihabitans sp. PAMC 28766]|nr:glycerophosphodiester phosphodiesterase family protein [Frondihabitans sp. PAMC 28766]AMM19845.1 glycerophosphodiester phosphodiesterase [Frondihabitans sp. PAMC 28766]